MIHTIHKSLTLGIALFFSGIAYAGNTILTNNNVALIKDFVPKINCNPSVILDVYDSAGGADGGNGNSSWTITTKHAHDLIVISASGFTFSGGYLSDSAGTVTVNGNNATFIKRTGISPVIGYPSYWVQTSVWVYAAGAPGTYSISCTE